MVDSPGALNPVPRSLLDQFLQALADLGASPRAIEGHLVHLRLWQRHLAPHGLLEGSPEDLGPFEQALADLAWSPGAVAQAVEAVEHFYAFVQEVHPAFEEASLWARHQARQEPSHASPMHEAIAKALGPALRRAEAGRLGWGRP